MTVTAPPAPVATVRTRTVVWLEGDHDVATVHDVTDALVMAICTNDADVVVDLSGVTFMSAATIGGLLRARYVLSRLSRRFVLRSPSRCAERILELAGLTFLVEVA